MSFEGKSIIITGAGGNFGREGCLYFALQGCKVAAFDVNASALEETVKYVQAKKPEAKKETKSKKKAKKEEESEAPKNESELIVKVKLNMGKSKGSVTLA